MHRRQYLVASAAAVAAAVSGCISGAENTSSDQVPGFDTNELEESIDLQEASVENQGQQDQPGIVIFRYTTSATSANGVYAEVPDIAVAIAEAIQDEEAFELAADTIELVALTESGEELISLTLSVDQMMLYVDGDVDEQRYREIAREDAIPEIPGYDRSAGEGSGPALQDYMDEADGTAVIRYTSTSEAEAREQAGTVAVTFADAIVDPDAFVDGVDAVSVIAVDEDGEELLTYSLSVGATVEYARGEMTEDEYRQRIDEELADAE